MRTRQGRHRILVQGLAGFGQARGPTRLSLKQGRAQSVFCGTNVGTDRRLGNVERLGSRAKTLMVNHSHKDLQSSHRNLKHGWSHS